MSSHGSARCVGVMGVGLEAVAYRGSGICSSIDICSLLSTTASVRLAIGMSQSKLSCVSMALHTS
jgi:hypothetical protein